MQDGVQRNPFSEFAGLTLSAALTEPIRMARDWLPFGEVNPLFDISEKELDAIDKRLIGEAGGLERPLIILSGYRSWPAIVRMLRHRLTRLTGAEPSRVYSLSYPHLPDIDRCVDRALDRVERYFPSDDPEWTREIDVVGVSMGGLVSRRAAMDRGERGHGRKRLNIKRLFTLGTPHRGALLAEKIAPDPAAKAMRPGSNFLEDLDRALEDARYELTCYAVQNDQWVGATRSAPSDRFPIWTRGSRIMSHFTVTERREFVTDIALRLRGLEPISKGTSAPPRD